MRLRERVAAGRNGSHKAHIPNLTKRFDKDTQEQARVKGLKFSMAKRFIPSPLLLHAEKEINRVLTSNFFLLKVQREGHTVTHQGHKTALEKAHHP